MSDTPHRTVLLHYHLFKNAGTSLDQVLKENFGAKWVTREFEARGSGQVHQAEVARWITDHPEALAFSSHTAELPPPEIPGVRVIPLIFVRHPVDRIASAYSFERKQGGNGFGSVLARHTSLLGYCEVRLSMGRDRQCRNFHCSRFGRMFDEAQGSELERSIQALQGLPFVGLVEEFDASMARLAQMLAPVFPDFKVRSVAANVSRSHQESLPQKLGHLREELGESGFALLTEANGDDLALYDAAVQRHERETAAKAD